MTAADHAPETANEPTAKLAELKVRFPHVRPPILMALSILLANPEIALADAKAQATLHGVRITAASVAGARRLLERMDPAPAAPPSPAATTAPTRLARRPRAAEPNADAEALIKGVVAKLQAQGGAEAERLRNTIRKAVELLASALA